MENKTVTISEPTFKKLRELKKLGFNAGEMDSFSKAYLACLQDEDKLQELNNIIFNEKIAPEDLDDIAPAAIWDGLVGFFGKCKVVMIS
jgi:predicted CopG family antitoxin